ncbi:hypothetical protein X975_08094, partial [Stegodyphus mimosarum]
MAKISAFVKKGMYKKMANAKVHAVCYLVGMMVTAVLKCELTDAVVS